MRHHPHKTIRGTYTKVIHTEVSGFSGGTVLILFVQIYAVYWPEVSTACLLASTGVLLAVTQVA